MSAHRDVARLEVAAALVDGVIVPGDVEVTAGTISAFGALPAGDGLAVPGFVDLQVNGFGGVDFLHADAAAFDRAGHALAATGVTAYQPTLISSPREVVVVALATLRDHRGDGRGPRVLPAHLEGPFLSPRHAGAHDPRHLAAVSTALADALCDAGPVGMMTVAPELDGCLALIGHLVGRGVAVSLGHSDASAPVAAAAFDAGAVAVTHVFNAMAPLTARQPGLAGCALARPDVVVMAIVDGVHLAAETMRLVIASAAGRLCLVTDAIAATAAGAGEHSLGGRDVVVRGREARLADGTLAGSVISMDAAIRNLVSLGVRLEDAVGAATLVPARIAGDAQLGRLAVGGRADVVVLDDALQVRRTLVDGIEIHAA